MLARCFEKFPMKKQIVQFFKSLIQTFSSFIHHSPPGKKRRESVPSDVDDFPFEFQRKRKKNTKFMRKFFCVPLVALFSLSALIRTSLAHIAVLRGASKRFSVFCHFSIAYDNFHNSDFHSTRTIRRDKLPLSEKIQLISIYFQ